MSEHRTSATDRSNMNKIYKPIAGYVGNVVKEVKDTARAASNAFDKADKKGYESKYGNKVNAKIGKSDVKAQAGQLAGAVLQARRYDAQGKQK
jgi:hypothetical protein